MQPFSGRGRFYFLRHGETPWNRERRIMGRRSIALSEEGRRQLAALEPYLSALGIESIWTGPLARARESAEIVARLLGGIAIAADDGLSEVDYGAWEGRTFDEVIEDPSFAELERDPLGARHGGGESLSDVRERIHLAMERIAARTGGAPALIVSHADPIRVVLCGCLQLDLVELRRLRLDPGGLSGIELTGDWAQVEFINLRPKK